jgi:hypothetical protein
MKAKLQRQQTCGCKGKKHFKNLIINSTEPVIKLGWLCGQDIYSEIKNNELMLQILREKALARNSLWLEIS